MPDTNSPTADTSTREIVTTRLFDAPPERVFEAWSRAEHLERWWGPRGFTTTTHAFDFRPGGTWKLTMHGPDGTDFPNRIVYDEIVRRSASSTRTTAGSTACRRSFSRR